MTRKRMKRKPNADQITIIDFKLVSFFDAKVERQIVLVYALGSDGLLREFTGTEWKAFPPVSEKT
jgi:hypothetical protein